MISQTGSVRVDLLGGTLDLNPINLILKDVITLNVATSLKAKVDIEASEKKGVEIVSLDYQSEVFVPFEDFNAEKLQDENFGPLSFVCQILHHLGLTSKVKVTLQSGSPAGAGLGGSSAMGVTLYKAICRYMNKSFDPIQAIREVNGVEGRILNSGPAGYQDYYPAMFGGVLALKAKLSGIEVEQLYSEDLKRALEERLTLVYSGETRLSGINNWEVYKAFFDGTGSAREGLTTIGHLSLRAYEVIKAKDYDLLIDLIAKEGAARRKLFPQILSPTMIKLHKDLTDVAVNIGIKVCGAGGGGCFLLTHTPDQRDFIQKMVKEAKMEVLSLVVDSPLGDNEVSSKRGDH